MTQLVPSLTVTERICVRRVRELPVAGVALKQIGDRVAPGTIVCRGEIPGEIVVVSPADQLGVTPAMIKNGYKVKVGDAVSTGSVLTATSYFFGLIRNEVASPIDGTIAFITSEQGRIGVQMASTVAEKIAYCGGRVASVDKDGTVELESEVSLVQGIFGVGGERVGAIFVLPCALDAPITSADLPADCSSLILVGGMAPAHGVLQEAASRGAVGFVCGSVDAAILKSYVGSEIGVAVTGDEPVSMSLVVTEGFGAIAMSPRAHAVLNERNGCIGAINGTTQVRAGAVRPEVIVPVTEAATSPKVEELPNLEVGSRVRLIRYPFFGLFGAVTALPDELHQIETGAAVRVLHAKLDDGRDVVIPRANIELLG